MLLVHCDEFNIAALSGTFWVLWFWESGFRCEPHWWFYTFQKRSAIPSIGQHLRVFDEHVVKNLVKPYVVWELLGGVHWSANLQKKVGHDSSIGMASRCGLDSRGSNAGVEGEIFRARPDRVWYPSQRLPGLSRGKTVGACLCPPSVSVKVKESIVIYIYSPSGPSWPVL
jgi:hypothetical protein